MVNARSICLAAVWACVSVGAAQAGTLTVAWDANTEPDLAGYLVSIGTLSGQYTSTIDVGRQTSYQFAEPDSSVAYYFAVRAYNSSGLIGQYSTEVRSTPSVPLPTVTTGAASAVSANGAMLNGVANPNGTPTSGYFEYGATPAYGLRTSLVSLGSGAQALAIPNGAVTNLSCNTTYNFRAVALNSAGSALGANAALTTLACPPPAVTTGTAISISDTGATLTATIDTRGTPTVASFQYGKTTQYGSTTATSTIGSGIGSVALPAVPLSCGTLYHYRAVGSASGTAATGADATFSTLACVGAGGPPTITVQPRGGKIFVGQTLQLTVQATGVAPIAYQWYLGDAGVMTNPIPGATAAVLVTPPMRSNASFWVRVSNPSGATNSIAAVISLKGRR